jgi:hypothetical protein
MMSFLKSTNNGRFTCCAVSEGRTTAKTGMIRGDLSHATNRESENFRVATIKNQFL